MPSFKFKLQNSLIVTTIGGYNATINPLISFHFKNCLKMRKRH